MYHQIALMRLFLAVVLPKDKKSIPDLLCWIAVERWKHREIDDNFRDKEKIQQSKP